MKKILITALVLAGFSATAQVKVGSNPTTLATNANFQVEGTTTAEQLVVLKTGNVGIGTTTPAWPLTINGASASVSVNRFGGVPHLINRHANGTQTTPTATAANDLITRISAWAYDGTQYLSNAYIDAIAKNNVTTVTRATDLSFNVANNTSVNEVMRISGSNGNVGIGTTAPTERLEVGAGGKLKLNRSDNNAGHTIFYEAPDDFRFLNGNGGAFKFGSNSVADMVTFAANGNVGIGTTAPGAKLHVLGTGTTVIKQLTLGNASTGRTIIQALRSTDGTQANEVGWDISTNLNLANDEFTIRQIDNPNSATYNRLTITKTGNVGIGTTTPTEKLDVAGSIKMVDGNQGAGKLMVSDAAGKATWTSAATALGASASKWTNDATNTRVSLTNLSDGTTARTAGTEFVVTDAGKVGIGLTNPEFDLTLKQSFNFGIGLSTDTDRVRLSNSVLDFYRATQSLIRQKTAGGALRFYARDLADTSDELLMVLRRGSVGIGNIVNPDSYALLAIKGKGNTSATKSFNIRNSDNTDIVSVLDNGNVGIGTTTPSHKLVVLKDAMSMPTYAPSASFAARFIGNTTANGIFLENYFTSGSGTFFAGASAGGTETAPTATLNQDLITTFEGRGYDGTTFHGGAKSLISATENWNATSRGTALSFFTTQNGTVQLLEKMRIDHNGNVGIGTATPQSKLHVTGLPIYADNAAAKAALGGVGVAEGAFYHTGDGIVRVVF